jgi:hypothetical protein
MFLQMIEDAGFPTARSMNGAGAAIGTGVHTGAARMLTNKRDHVAPAPQSEIREISIEAYRAETRDGVLFDTVSPNHNTAENQVDTLVNIYRSEILPVVIPVDIETAMQFDVTSGVTVSGHPDVMCGSEIRDLKCGKIDPQCQAQMGGYSLLAQDNGRPRPDRLVIDWIPRNKPVPVTSVYDVALCETMARSVLNQVISHLTAFLKTGSPEAFPVNPMSILCGPKYCPAHGSKWCGIKNGGKEDE